YAVQTGTLTFTAVVNNRLGSNAIVKQVLVDGVQKDINQTLSKNKNFSTDIKLELSRQKAITQPYWLNDKKEEGAFYVADQQMIGVPDVAPAFTAAFTVNISGRDFVFQRPVKYKYTDPVKGELYQPLIVVPPVTVTASPRLLVVDKPENKKQTVQIQLHAYANIEGAISCGLTGIDYSGSQSDLLKLDRGKTATYHFEVTEKHEPEETYTLTPYAGNKNAADTANYYLALK